MGNYSTWFTSWCSLNFPSIGSFIVGSLIFVAVPLSVSQEVWDLLAKIPPCRIEVYSVVLTGISFVLLALGLRFREPKGLISPLVGAGILLILFTAFSFLLTFSFLWAISRAEVSRQSVMIWLIALLGGISVETFTEATSESLTRRAEEAQKKLQKIAETI